MTGYELLEIFRTDPNLRTVPVIVISAKADRAATRRGMELGATDFITKPFTEEEVIRSVAARLERQELVEDLDAFCHTVAHDLKNPLATLTGWIELTLLLVGKADEATLRHHLTKAVDSGRQLNGIIEGLLVLAGVRGQSVTAGPLDTAPSSPKPSNAWGICWRRSRRISRSRFPGPPPSGTRHGSSKCGPTT